MINIYCSLFIAIAIVPERELARSVSIIKLSKRMQRMREYDVGLCGLFTFYIVILTIITISFFPSHLSSIRIVTDALASMYMPSNGHFSFRIDRGSSLIRQFSISLVSSH